MTKKKIFLIMLAFILLLSTTTPVLAASEGEDVVNFGWLSLLPPLIAIVLAFVTKQVVLSLFIGVFTGSLMLNGWNPFYGFLRALDEYMIPSLADSWYAAIIIFTITIGGMIGIVTKMGGTQAVANYLIKKAKTPVSAQIVTGILGCLVFFDDLANLLIVGPTMRPLTDKLKVSREKLSYIVDSTASPVAGLALISTWIGFELGLINTAFESLGIDVNAYDVYFRSIPYYFYNIFALAMVFLLAYMGKDFGPMYEAEKRARLTGKVLADDASPLSSNDIEAKQADSDKEYKAYNAIIPIMTLIVVAFCGLWYNGYLNSDPGVDPFTIEGIRTCFGNADSSVVLVWGAVTASIVAGILANTQKILNLQETFDAWFEGAKGLLDVSVILVFSWSLGSVIQGVGTADFLVGIVAKSNMPAGFLPALVFTISCLVAFATGTSWGTMTIVVPLAVPLAASLVSVNPTESPIVLASLSAVLAGAIFGDHCSPISDTTILSSMSSGSDHLHHVKTQIPYALIGAGLAIVGLLLVGFMNLTPIVIIPLGLTAVWAIIHFFGKSTKLEDLKMIEEDGKTL
ncbi:Na+/H+ antiporter NhaC family protein [Wukongibacter baidiensis]|uniref:Na+/H+ antiporter NhaC family protein n=1 Tax=Wukongibacter baidiensis TaxID=1723361 RepID=UPI003D7F88A4